MSKRANIPWSRIEARLAELEKDQAWLRATLEIEPNVITNWKSRGAPASKAVPIAQALGLSTDQLLGLSTEAADVPGAMRVVVAEPGDPDFYDIPKVQLLLSAGMTGFQTVPEIYDGNKLSVSKKWVDRNGFVPDRLVAIRIKGDSMEPNLYEGDQVIINTADTSLEDGVVFAVNFEGQAVVKRLARDRGEWWLTSDNPDQVRHRRKSCRDGECIIIGRIVKRETDRI